MSEEFERCPFCGCHDSTITITSVEVNERFYYRCCDMCESGGPWERTKDEANASWNKRLAPLKHINGLADEKEQS